MKVKYSLIPFIPAALAMMALRVMSMFFADDSGKVFGMDKMAVAYTVIGIAVALFVVCVIINIFDRKTAPVYPVKKNLPAGVLAALSGAMVIASSVGTFMNSTTDSEYYVMTLVCAIFSIPAGIAFFLMARIHFQGKSIVSGLSMIFVFPALWGCTELVHQFLEATKVSISATDLTGLFCFIFFTLYYFSHAMVVSRIKGRNPVKGCFIYGLPAIALGLSYSVYTFYTGLQEGFGYVSALNAGMFLALSLYAVSFLTEMTAKSYTKDELEIIDGLPQAKDVENEEKKYIKTDSYDDLVFPDENAKSADSTKKADSDSTAAAVERPAEYYQNAQGLDDFIIGYNAPVDDEPVPYLTKHEMEMEHENAFVTLSGDTEDEALRTQTKQPAPAVESAPVVEETSVPVVEEKTEPVVEINPAPAAKPAPVPEVKPQTVKDSSRSAIDDLLKELDSKK